MGKYYSKDGSIYAVIEGHTESGKTLFSVHYSRYCEVFEEHEIKLYSWAKHLHGNAPSGTPYGYFRSTRNGKRIIITV